MACWPRSRVSGGCGRLLQERSLRRSETVAEQLQAALNSRVVLEQAKGKLAERLTIDMDHAFRLLRDYPRNSNQRLTGVARNFVDSATADFPPSPAASHSPVSWLECTKPPSRCPLASPGGLPAAAARAGLAQGAAIVHW
jgi:ANTAR domain